jgi:hypothetical protein
VYRLGQHYQALLSARAVFLFVNVEKIYLLLEVVFQGVEVLFVKTHTFGFNPLKRNG